MKIEYSKVGDYYYPNLKRNRIPHLNKYGLARLTYLKEQEHILYTNLSTSDRLGEHLSSVQQEAIEMREVLIKQYKKSRNITEDLKAKDQMQWVQEMNNIQKCIDEVIYNELIYQ